MQKVNILLSILLITASLQAGKGDGGRTAGLQKPASYGATLATSVPADIEAGKGDAGQRETKQPGHGVIGSAPLAVTVPVPASQTKCTLSPKAKAALVMSGVIAGLSCLVMCAAALERACQKAPDCPHKGRHWSS